MSASPPTSQNLEKQTLQVSPSPWIWESQRWHPVVTWKQHWRCKPLQFTANNMKDHSLRFLNIQNSWQFSTTKHLWEPSELCSFGSISLVQQLLQSSFTILQTGLSAFSKRLYFLVFAVCKSSKPNQISNREYLWLSTQKIYCISRKHNPSITAIQQKHKHLELTYISQECELWRSGQNPNLSSKPCKTLFIKHTTHSENVQRYWKQGII
jgi:hypothetical protein